MPSMTDDLTLALLWAAWLSLSTMPLGFMLGSSCSPCCEPAACGVTDGKPRTDPKNEGTWVPSGTWRGVGGVTWSFTANPGDDSGETWFFYGSASTSKVGGGASTAERQDWGNICNWYSNKTTSPSVTSGFPGAFDKRATRLPPQGATVHIYTDVSTNAVGSATVARAYFWSSVSSLLTGSTLTATATAHDSPGGVVFNSASISNLGTVNGGAIFNDARDNFGTVNGGALFFGNTSGRNFGTVNGGATFSGNIFSQNAGTVNGGATFESGTFNGNVGTVNGGATFNGNTYNDTTGVVSDGATFNNTSVNQGGVVNGGATFNDNSQNASNATVNGGATFNNSSRNAQTATVNGGATFNDSACSQRTTGNFFATPCTRKFVAHPTDLPTCNGTANNGCVNSNDSCGCG